VVEKGVKLAVASANAIRTEGGNQHQFTSWSISGLQHFSGEQTPLIFGQQPNDTKREACVRGKRRELLMKLPSRCLTFSSVALPIRKKHGSKL
jgi:hypothetical protein